MVQRLGVPEGIGKLFLVSYSLGANVTAKMLAEDGPDSPVTAAVACACPVDMLPLANYMAYNPWGKVWDSVLVHGCNTLIRSSPVLRQCVVAVVMSRHCLSLEFVVWHCGGGGGGGDDGDAADAV